MNKKGFTLMELLIVIFIIAMIPLIFVTSFGRTTTSVDEEEQENKKTVLQDAIEVYYYLGIKNETIAYYIDSKTEEIVTCISIGSLISNGYLLEENYDPNQTVLVKSKNGNLTYEIINDTDLDVCTYEEVSISGVYEGETKTSSDTDEELGYYEFNQIVTSTDVNTFNVDLAFKFKASAELEIDVKKDTYVLMIVDHSTSMSELDISNANAAVEALSTILTANNDANFTFCNALVGFGSTAELHSSFTTSKLNGTIIRAGGTAYAPPLEMAYKMIYTSTSGHSSACQKSADPNSNVVVVFMSDGYPGDADSVYGPVAEKLKDKGAKIITIGYGTANAALKKISSGYRQLEIERGNFCEYISDKICYYPNTSDLSDVFQEIAQNTIKEARSEFKSALLELNLSKYFEFSKGAGIINDNGTIKIQIDLEDVNDNGFASDKYDFDILYAGGVDFGSKNTIEIPIFDNVYIYLLDANGNPKTDEAGNIVKISVSNLPKITLSKYSASAKN